YPCRHMCPNRTVVSLRIGSIVSKITKLDRLYVEVPTHYSALWAVINDTLLLEESLQPIGMPVCVPNNQAALFISHGRQYIILHAYAQRPHRPTSFSPSRPRGAPGSW